MKEKFNEIEYNIGKFINDWDPVGGKRLAGVCLFNSLMFYLVVIGKKTGNKALMNAALTAELLQYAANQFMDACENNFLDKTIHEEMERLGIK